jgi:hypothetical protein
MLNTKIRRFYGSFFCTVFYRSRELIKWIVFEKIVECTSMQDVLARMFLNFVKSSSSKMYKSNKNRIDVRTLNVKCMAVSRGFYLVAYTAVQET